MAALKQESKATRARSRSGQIDVDELRSYRRKLTVYLSPFLLAVMIFGLLNAALGFLHPIKIDPYVLPYRNWIWWDINDLRTSSQPYNVTLLGSSLIISAINSCDANYLNKKLDQIQYHGAAYLDHCLEQKFGGKFHTFNLSTPGRRLLMRI